MSDSSSLTRRQVAGAAILGALAMALPEAAEAKPDKTAMAPILNLVKAYDTAFNQQNLAGVVASFTPNAIMMGTAHGEVWSGTAAITDAYKHIFKDFDKGSLSFEHTWWDGALNGDSGWFMATDKVTHTHKGKSNSFSWNFSVNCVQENGKWLFHTMHFSSLHGPG